MKILISKQSINEYLSSVFGLNLYQSYMAKIIFVNLEFYCLKNNKGLSSDHNLPDAELYRPLRERQISLFLSLPENRELWCM